MKDHRDNRPSKLARWVISRFSNYGEDFPIEGDMMEAYLSIREKRGKSRADFWIWKQIIKTIPAYISYNQINKLTMLKNYLKVTMRNIVKYKLHSGINITGLALGLAGCILILSFIGNELSYDSFHKNAKDIYRIYITEDLPDRDPFSYSVSPAPLANALEQSFPEVNKAVRIYTWTDIVKIDKKNFTERVHLVDRDFFQMFDFPIIVGGSNSIFKHQNSVVMTPSVSRKFFGEKNALGKSISIKLGNNFYDFVVSGIAEPAPENSSIQYQMLIPYENISKIISQRKLSHWFNVQSETYLHLNSQLDPETIKTKLSRVVQNHYPKRTINMVTLSLQPIEDIHLNPSIPAGIEPISNPMYSYILLAIAVLIILVACINFMILAIGQSSSRAKEVGIRKVMGARQNQLRNQFWGEAVVMSLIALVLSIGLAHLLLPLFNQLVNKNLIFSYSALSVTAFLVLAIVTGLIAGGYPALILSRFKPVEVLKGKFKIKGGSFFGKSLVTSQFALSILLIICTFIMVDQLRYLTDRHLGFDQEQVMVIRNFSPPKTSHKIIERFRNKLAPDTEIIGMTGTSNQFSGYWTKMGFKTTNNTYKEFYQITTDYDFINTMKIKLVIGRSFSRNFPSDAKEAIIVNEAFVDYFNWASPQREKIPGPKFPAHRIIGVVENFNFLSLQNKVAPLAIVLNPQILFKGINDIDTSHSPGILNFINIRVKTNNLSNTIKRLKNHWQKISDNQPFIFTFMDEDLQRQYQEEKHWCDIVSYASAFAIIISCLGLFGLANLIAVKRTREIGIRKVLGANKTNILLLITKDFYKLVTFANVFAWPIAYIIMNRWLNNFVFRANIRLHNFVFAAIFAILISTLVISYQSIKTTLTDPIKTIKYE
jgi:putative ABC transport system permease protein